MIDVSTLPDWDDNELEQSKLALESEIRRRNTIRTAEEEMNRIVRDYARATGRKDGDPWSQPTGAHDSYPLGVIVQHGGKEWISLISGNVWEPGVSGWREHSSSDSEYVPEFIHPTGAHDAYMMSDRVTFLGIVYESLMDGNAYSPAEYPAGWVEIVKPAPQVPAPEPEPEPTEPPVEETPAFIQPTGSHDTYQVGDMVLFNGVTYRSLIANNAYSPSAYPAGWEVV